jgi:FKBP-type peptidyl-prolyl cis-trans isomerase FklB
MKHITLLAIFVALLAGCSKQGGTVDLKTKTDSISYAIGMNIGKDIKDQSIETNVDAIAAGIRDVVTNGTKRLTEEQVQVCMTALQADMMAKQQAKAANLGKSNKEEGEKFLTENKTKEGVKTTASGLQYKVIKEGKGAMPKATDVVVTHYRGTLINGKEFDSSHKRGQPAEFPVNGVIPGWTEALQLMKVGSKWQLFIPPALAYGERGAGADIGPNSTLIFEIELLNIKGQ